MKRALGWGVVFTALGLAGLGVVVALAPAPPAPPGPEPGRSLFRSHCATCHGADGRGATWRARLLLLRPGNLAHPRVATLPDQYLFDVIRHGGSNFGKPGMPSFGFLLHEEEIHALVGYLRMLPPTPPPARASRGG